MCGRDRATGWLCWRPVQSAPVMHEAMESWAQYSAHSHFSPSQLYPLDLIHFSLAGSDRLRVTWRLSSRRASRKDKRLNVSRNQMGERALATKCHAIDYECHGGSGRMNCFNEFQDPLCSSPDLLSSSHSWRDLCFTTSVFQDALVMLTRQSVYFNGNATSVKVIRLSRICAWP
ncbi:hypothetical protein F2P79_002799 [Pimephales promelas]|nr:hypothetical protein F2P79_002799 [Pimephales promelas]